MPDHTPGAEAVADKIAAYARECFTGSLSGREAEARVKHKILKALSATPDKERGDLGDRSLRELAIEALTATTSMCREYAQFIQRVPAVSLEEHPYLPAVQGAIEDAEAALSALSKARSAGNQEERNKGLEEAARWHDYRAGQEALIGSRSGERAERYAAQEIRALKHSPKAGQGGPRRGRCEYPNCGGECAECQP